LKLKKKPLHVSHSRLQSCITLLMLCIALMLALLGHAQMLVPGQPEPINLTFLGANSSLYVCTKGGTGTKSSDTAIGTTSKGKKSGTVSAASTNLSTVFSTSCVLPPQDSLTLTTENDLPNAITAFGNDASFINLSMPLNMVAGQSYDVAVSMKNSGNTTWQPGTWKLGSQAPQDNTIWGPNRVQLAAPVGPGGSVAFFFTIRAPTTPGIYTYKWQMVQEFVEFFGASTTEYQISVTAPPLPPPPTPVPTLTVTRTPTTMVANQSFTLNWSTTNATSLTRVCTSTGTGFVANGTLATNGSAPGTASSAWVGFPSTCTWTANGAGGSKQVIETMTTNAAAPPPPPPPPPPPSGPTVTYIHTDGLGSPVARTNEQGQLISRTRYEPYGATAGGATPGIGFTGHVNDPETGLTYMQQRYYDPLAGRFMSVDPVLTDANTGASFNRYVYANNSPYRYIDPDGRQVIVIAAKRPTTPTGNPFDSPVGLSPTTNVKMPSTPNLAIDTCVSLPFLCITLAVMEKVEEGDRKKGSGKKNNGKKGNSNTGLGNTKPNDAPPGTIGLDEASKNNNWDKDTSHDIKDGATGGMGGGRTWIGVAPDGTVGVNQDGKWEPQGHFNDLKN
jgi:RHS repeat-associated protein